MFVVQLLLVAALACCLPRATRADDVMRWHRVPSSIHYYEPVSGLSTRDTSNKGPGAVEMSFDTLGKHFDLDLQPHQLVAPGAKTLWIGDGVTVESQTPNVFYRGRVRGEAGSWVGLSMSNGVVEGIIGTPSQLYFVEPAANYDESAGAADLIAYRVSDTEPDKPNARCGTEGAEVDGSAWSGRRFGRAVAGDSTAPQAPQAQAAVVSFTHVEVAVVADYELFHKLDLLGINAEDVMLNQLNMVSAIYEAELDTTLEVVKTVVYTSSSDPFSNTTVPGTLLDQFTALKGNPNSPIFGYDMAHLFTGRDLDNSVVGIAWVGTVCVGDVATGLSQYLTTSNYVWLTAHEMGHNFNAVHDPLDCTPPMGYIMQPNLSCVDHNGFSQASKDAMMPFISGLSCADTVEQGTPTPTRTRTPTGPPTATFTPSNTRPPTSTPTMTPTRTTTKTRTPTPTITPTQTRTPTRPPTSTRTPVVTPTLDPNFAPTSLSGLVLWLDASQMVGMADGQSVSTWQDVSGGNHHATQAQSAKQPIYHANWKNGLPAVQFDGIDDFLPFSSAVVSGSQLRTIFIVGRPDVAANRCFLDLGNGAVSLAGFCVTPEYALRINGGNRFYTTAASTSAPAMIAVRMGGTSTSNVDTWVNGAKLTVKSTASATVNTSGTGCIGAWTATPSSSKNFDGDIAEVIVYNRALSGTERGQVQIFLRNKYGL